MKRNIIVFALCLFSISVIAQDQIINNIILQDISNQWRSSAKIQIGRSGDGVVGDRAEIGVSDGNLHLDSYPGYGLYLNYFQKGSIYGNKGLTIVPSGNVGIGTMSPVSKLDVNGDINIDGNLHISQNINVGSNIKLSGGEITYVYNDGFIYDQKSMGYYSMKWVFDTWQQGAPSLWLSGLGGIKLFTGGQKPSLSINHTGSIGIGTEDPQSKLDVRGKIIADEVEIKVNTGADHVFKPNYALKSLSEVESFINENNHLPEIPSEKQMQKDGLNINEFQIKLLQKIEELTLYVIQQEKQLEEQGALIKTLEGEIKKISTNQ